MFHTPFEAWKNKSSSLESIRNKTKLQVRSLCCKTAANVSWLPVPYPVPRGSRMHKAAITHWSACSSELVSLLCLTGIHSTGPSSVQAGWKAAYMEHERWVKGTAGKEWDTDSFITPLESKETFYVAKMGSRLTKNLLTLKYIINRVYHAEQQNQVNAGFHKQSG